MTQNKRYFACIYQDVYCYSRWKKLYIKLQFLKKVQIIAVIRLLI